MKRTLEIDYPDIDAVVAAAVVAMEDVLTVYAVDDADREEFYYLRLHTDFGGIDPNDVEDPDTLSQKQRDALADVLTADERNKLAGDGLLVYRHGWNLCALFVSRDETYQFLLDYVAYQEKLYPRLTIVNGGIRE